MKKILFFLITAIYVTGCVYENEEDEYYSIPKGQKNSLDSGLIAHYCFQNSLVDSSINNIIGTLNGTPVYVADASLGSDNMALSFNGTDNSFKIPVGQLDTIAISIFYKATGVFSESQSQNLLDYGHDALALNLDGVSGGTYLALNGNDLNADLDNNWICSFAKLNHIYIGAILSKKQVTVIATTFGDRALNMKQRLFSVTPDGIITLGNNFILIGSSSVNQTSVSSFKGLIDDIRVYNRKLSNTEIYQITKAIQ
jgi:hypothetical protein